MEIKELLDLSEENKELRKTIQQIVDALCNELCDENSFDVRYLDGISKALSIIQEKCGASIEEILDPKVR